jgi:predicted MarR family transcription regulator
VSHRKETSKEKWLQTPAEIGQALSEMELALTVLWNSIHRWLGLCGSTSRAKGLSELDVFLLHLLVYRNRTLRGIDLAFSLSIDDMHLVTYSLKKLARLHLVAPSRVGKEVFYTPTKTGKQSYFEFLEARAKFLEPAIKPALHEYDLESLTSFLRTLASTYEQAARAAGSVRGIEHTAEKTLIKR